MYSGITKIFYRKTVRHLFTETCTNRRNDSIFFVPTKLLFIVVHISAARQCEFMLWENGRSGGEVVLYAGISHE